MPELPEVETIKRELEKTILGLRILNLQVFDKRVLNKISPKEFIKQIKNQKIIRATRRAKAVILSFESGYHLTIQPKMTGYFFIQNPPLRHFTKETKVVFVLSNGIQLLYNDHRMFGKLSFVRDLDSLSYIQSAGPEPLENHFNVEWIKKQSANRRIAIKQLLLDQKFVAGIGNIYASEILFAAGVNPKKASNKLKSADAQRIYHSTLNILKEAIEYRGTSMRDYRDPAGEKGNFFNRIKVYGREGEFCLSCKEMIKRIVQGQRSTFYCPKCQPMR